MILCVVLPVVICAKLGFTCCGWLVRHKAIPTGRDTDALGLGSE
jgi:hypothetical protein